MALTIMRSLLSNGLIYFMVIFMVTFVMVDNGSLGTYIIVMNLITVHRRNSSISFVRGRVTGNFSRSFSSGWSWESISLILI